MKTIRIIEREPATTITRSTSYRYEKQDMPSNDIAMYHLIEKYDRFIYGYFHPKIKPYWQIPILPDYV